MSFSWRSTQAEGFILKRKNYGEADRIITIFTKSQGKIITVAKGVRKIKSRKSSHVELLNKVNISLSETKSLPILIEAVSLKNFAILKSSLESVAYAYKLLEVIDRLCPEKEVHPVIFYLLEKSLDQLNARDQSFSKEIVEQFCVSLLRELGYLEHGKQLSGDTLERYLRVVTEKNLSSSSLLTHIHTHV